MSSLVWSLKLSQTEIILASRQADLNDQTTRLQVLEATLADAQSLLKEKERQLRVTQAAISSLAMECDDVQASLATSAQRHGQCLERRPRSDHTSPMEDLLPHV